MISKSYRHISKSSFMPNWLTKTFRTISQVVEPEPVPYEITCYCEDIYEGKRNSHSQIVQCQQCGERLFIFPTNVYPEPKQSARQKQQSSSTSSAKKRKEKQHEVSTQSLTATQQISQPETEPLEEVITSTEPEGIPMKQKRFIRPFYLILGCIGLTILLTGGWLFRSYQQDNAVETLRTATEAGEKAIQNNNLILAEQEFAKAAHAARILKQHNTTSNDVQQMHKELIVVNNLSHLSLFNLTTDLESKYHPQNPEAWRSHFQKDYADRWVIIEAEIVREQGTSFSLLLNLQQQKREEKEKKKGNQKPPKTDITTEADKEKPTSQRYVVHYPIEVQRVPLVLSVTLPALDQLPFKNSTQKVLFAGKLHRCELLNVPEPTWVIDFVPNSPLLWSHYKLLQAVGFPNDDSKEKQQLQSILINQTKLLEEDE